MFMPYTYMQSTVNMNAVTIPEYHYITETLILPEFNYITVTLQSYIMEFHYFNSTYYIRDFHCSTGILLPKI